MIFHPSIKTISNYLDDHLDEKKKTSVESHLERCEACRKKVRFLNRTAVVFQAPDDEMKSMSDGIMSRLEKKHEEASAEFIGKIISVTGNVLVNNKNSDELQMAFPGISVVRGDSLITADDGKALLALDDGSCIYINKSTELDFSDARHSAVLDRGEFFAMMKPQKAAFTVGTPAAVLNVVGTDFDTVVTDSRETILKVLKGEVEFCTGPHKVPVKRRRQVSTIINQAPVKEKIRNPKSVKGWTNDMDSKNSRGNKGGMFKKLLAGLIAVIIALGIYYAFQAQTRSIDSRVPADLSFEELYRLEEGEYLKVISPPFIPEREEYYKKEVPYQEGNIATSIYFEWENDQLQMTNRMHGSSPIIESYIYSTTSLQLFRITGDRNILSKRIEGDFIYRPSVNYEENMGALEELEEIISRAVNRNIRLEFRDMPVMVRVMGNNLKDEYVKGKKLEINIPAMGRQGGSYSGSTSLNNMADILGTITGRGVIFEAQARPDTNIVFKIDFHHDDIKKDSQWLFDEFAAQTGLTFAEEERIVSMLFIELDDSRAFNESDYWNAYRLDDGQFCKLISPPYPKGRNEFYLDDSLSGPRIPESIIFEWVNGKRRMRGAGIDLGVKLEFVLDKFTADHIFQIEGDEHILNKRFKNDFVISGYNESEASTAIGQFEKMVSEALGQKIRLEYGNLPRKVLILGGQLKLNPADNINEKIVIRQNPNDASGNMTRTDDGRTIFHLLRKISELTKVKIVGIPKADPKYHYDYLFEYDPSEIENDYQWIYDQITTQTGFTIREETRNVTVLFVTEEN